MRFIFAFLFLGALIALNAVPWRESKSFTLKKDQLVKILIKSAGQERLLTFRWTLHTDKVLVVHESFDRFVGQHMLYSNYANNSFQKRLLPPARSQRDVPYALVVFKKFDEGNNTAQMDFHLIDKENRIILDYLTEK